MIDTLLQHRAKADQSTILEDLALADGGYAVITLHRPANVDNRESLEGLIEALEHIQNDLTVVFPAHPRTRAKFEEFGMGNRLAAMSNLRILDPVGYLDFLKLIAAAKVVLTDSGGIQEETTILKVPCLTLRENTERPITLEVGSNRLVGSDPSKIIAAYREIITGELRVQKYRRFGMVAPQSGSSKSCSGSSAEADLAPAAGRFQHRERRAGYAQKIVEAKRRALSALRRCQDFRDGRHLALVLIDGLYALFATDRGSAEVVALRGASAARNFEALLRKLAARVCEILDGCGRSVRKGE